MLALIYEQQDKQENLDEALRIWNKMKTAKGAERTIAILRNLGRKDFATKYSRWVFDVSADIGLKLFTEARGKTAIDDSSFRPNPQLNMNVDEVLEFLIDVQDSQNRSQGAFGSRRGEPNIDLSLE